MSFERWPTNWPSRTWAYRFFRRELANWTARSKALLCGPERGDSHPLEPDRVPGPAAAEALVAALENLVQVQRSTRGLTRALADASPDLRCAPGLTGPLADLLRAVAGELDTWVLTAAEGPPEGVDPAVTTVADKYREVLLAARSAGVVPELAATADAVAIYGLRISDDLRTNPQAPASRPTWRSLLGH